MEAAPWSTCMLAVQSLGYGNDTMRLPGPGVTMSSGVRAVRIHACGLAAATALKRDHSAPMRARCSCSVQPLAARKRVLEQGVGVHREEHAALHLELGGARLFEAEERGGRRVFGLGWSTAARAGPGPGGPGRGRTWPRRP